MTRVLAQKLNIGDYEINGPEQFSLAGDTIGSIVGKSLGLVFAAAGIGLLLMIISSGFTLMMSAGDAKKAAAGKTTLTNSIVGFILVFAAFWIVQIMGTVLGWEGILEIFGR